MMVHLPFNADKELLQGVAFIVPQDKMIQVGVFVIHKGVLFCPASEHSVSFLLEPHLK